MAALSASVFGHELTNKSGIKTQQLRNFSRKRFGGGELGLVKITGGQWIQIGVVSRNCYPGILHCLFSRLISLKIN